MKVLALHIGKARQIEPTGTSDWWDKPWQTGFFKEPQGGSRWLGYEGFRSDEQADRRYHGGPEKAVCVYFSGHYPYWRDTLGLPDLPYGAFGENLTVEGQDEDSVCIGDRYSLGTAEVQISQPRQPCWKLARRWQVKDLAARVEQNGFTGFYFRVVRHGQVQTGDLLQLLDRPFPEWSVARCNRVMHHAKQDYADAEALAGCPLLSSSWKDSLWLRAEKKLVASTAGRTAQPDQTQ